jgi:hypothetical protein
LLLCANDLRFRAKAAAKKGTNNHSPVCLCWASLSALALAVLADGDFEEYVQAPHEFSPPDPASPAPGLLHLLMTLKNRPLSVL